MNHALIQEKKQILSCGSEVFYIPRDWTETFCLRIQFPIGTFLETPQNNGISSLCIRMLLEGTKQRGFLELAEDLESVGIEYQTFSTGIQFHCCTYLQEHLIGFISEILCYSEPSRERFEQTLKHMRSELRTFLDDSDQLAFTRLRQSIYEGNAGALFPGGTQYSLDLISYEEFLAFRNRYLSAKNLKVFLCGHIRENEFFNGLDSGLKNFHQGKKEDVVIPVVEQTQQNQSYYVFKDRNKSSVVLGHQGIKKWSRDYSRLKVMDQILGQSMGFTCRLANRLREELGLCYSVFGDITSTASRMPGLFQVFIGTSPNTVEKAIEEIRSTVGQFLEDGPEIGEVEDTRMQLMEGFIFQFETNASMVQLLYEKEAYGLDEEFLIREQGEFKKISCEEVHHAAETYLHPDQFVTLVVGREPIDGFQELSSKFLSEG